MRTRKKTILAIVSTLFCLGLVWAAANINYQTRPAHLMDATCGDCHLGQKLMKQKKNARSNRANADENIMLVSSQEKLCVRCHLNALEASHPSGLKPNMPLPKEFPADWKGDLTCSTCHTIHGDQPGLMRTAKRGKALCLSCHKMEFFDNMADGGQSLLVSGHIGQPADLMSIGLDTYSIHCMTCHAELGDDLAVSISNDGVMRHALGSVNHPVGVIYDEAARFGGYRPSTFLPEEIKLPEGKVSCLSCHRAYTEDHGEIVRSNRGSDLCFQCHDI